MEQIKEDKEEYGHTLFDKYYEWFTPNLYEQCEKAVEFLRKEGIPFEYYPDKDWSTLDKPGYCIRIKIGDKDYLVGPNPDPISKNGVDTMLYLMEINPDTKKPMWQSGVYFHDNLDKIAKKADRGMQVNELDPENDKELDKRKIVYLEHKYGEKVTCDYLQKAADYWIDKDEINAVKAAVMQYEIQTGKTVWGVWGLEYKTEERSNVIFDKIEDWEKIKDSYMKDFDIKTQEKVKDWVNQSYAEYADKICSIMKQVYGDNEEAYKQAIIFTDKHPDDLKDAIGKLIKQSEQDKLNTYLSREDR